MDGDVHTERGPGGEILLGPLHQGILRKDLENSGNHRPAIRTQTWDIKVRSGHIVDDGALQLKPEYCCEAPVASSSAKFLVMTE